MYPEYERLLTFVSVQHALRAEEKLREHGIPTAMVPVPREIAVTCGQCLIFSALQEQKVLSLLRKLQVPLARLFERDYPVRQYRELPLPKEEETTCQ